MKFIMSMKNVTVLMQSLNDSIIYYGSFDFLYENTIQCPKRHMLLTACVAVLSLWQLAMNKCQSKHKMSSRNFFQ